MNVLFLSIDSLRRDHLGTYDKPIDWVDELGVQTPNLDRFAERSLVFDNHYVGSLPCMPARREWMAGVKEFLWRPWGPMEPFDEPLPRKVRDTDTVTQLITDHFHYFQHGSNGYFEDFHGFEFIRGHEDDAWKTFPKTPDETLLRQVGYELEEGSESGETNEAADGSTEESSGAMDLFEELGLDEVPEDPYDTRKYRPRAAYVRNVEEFETEEDFFTAKVFSEVSEWLSANQEWDKWFLYIDEFDVHEPFHCPEPYASMYTDEDPQDPELTVWPYYGRTDEGQSALTDRELDFVRAQFAGKTTMVDRWFGKLMDKFDELDLWDDTMVVVTSDHGHFLGEDGWIGKPVVAPDYDVLAKTPLLVWHPDSPRMGERTSALTTAVDLHDTLLEALDTPVSDTTHSQSLMPLLSGETEEHRDWVLYGWWGSSMNVTDGEYTYHYPCRNDVPSYCFSTTMMDTWGWMTPTTVPDDPEAGQFLPYTDTPVWKYTGTSLSHEDPLLFNVAQDPAQTESLVGREDAKVAEMRDLMAEALDELRAPPELYDRLDISP